MAEIGVHMTTILIVDDDPGILDMVELTLRREGYIVQRAANSAEALRSVDFHPPELVIVDAVLPDIDGFDLCRMLRELPATRNIPILFLSATRDTQTAVEALNAGGDDFLRKPIYPRELAARVRAHIRRSVQISGGENPTIRILPSSYRVFVNDREISLTRVEFDLLLHLCRVPGEAYSTEDLLLNVWKYPDGVGDAALVRNHIHNLRRKVEEDPERPLIIQSRHGRGYVVKAEIHIGDEVALR